MDTDNTYCFNCGTQIDYMGVVYGKNITGCIYCTKETKLWEDDDDLDDDDDLGDDSNVYL